MMNNPGLQSGMQRAYESDIEREIGESLESTIALPWTLAHDPETMEVRSGSGHMPYTPDFLITNAATGHSLAVEVKSTTSLSLPNVLKITHIKEAFEKRGTDFLVVVHGDADETQRANEQLGEFGVNAIGVSRASDVAGEIKKQLAGA